MNLDLTDSDGDFANATPTGSPQASLVNFDGDTGSLPMETRRVLVQLMLGPSMDARRQSKLWPVLLRDEQLLRSRLHDLFLELIVDRDHQVAFCRQVRTEDGDAPVLLRRSSLNFLESALLLHLRERLTQSDAQVERAVVSQQELRDHLLVFERSDNEDKAGFGGRVDAAIEKLARLSFLIPLGRGTHRFEVSPTLKLLFSAAEISELARRFTQAAVRSSTATGPAIETDGLENNE